MYKRILSMAAAGLFAVLLLVPAAAQAAPSGSSMGVEPRLAALEALVAELQTRLKQLGYYEGEIDEAKTLVSDAYMQRFEGLEGGLIELDPELVEGLEEDFNASLPNAMESGKDEQVATLVKSMKARLDQSRELLAGQESVEGF